MSSCCAPQPACALPTQALASVITQPFHSTASVISYLNVSPWVSIGALYFTLMCESTVTLTFNGQAAYDSTLFPYVPLVTSINITSAFAPTTPIVDATLSAQTIFAQSSWFVPLNLNAAVVLPAGAYSASVQFAQYLTFALPGDASLILSGTMAATIIKTRA